MGGPFGSVSVREALEVIRAVAVAWGGRAHLHCPNLLMAAWSSRTMVFGSHYERLDVSAGMRGGPCRAARPCPPVEDAEESPG